jgi:hypothetical protein
MVIAADGEIQVREFWRRTSHPLAHVLRQVHNSSTLLLWCFFLQLDVDTEISNSQCYANRCARQQEGKRISILLDALRA